MLSTTQGGAGIIPFITIHYMCIIAAFDSKVHVMSVDAGDGWDFDQKRQRDQVCNPGISC